MFIITNELFIGLPMQILHKRFSVITGFALLLILLAVNAVITVRQLRIQVGNQAWITRTQQIRLELSQTESLLKDAETGQRGFLLTSDPKYLAPYRLAVAQIEPHLQHLTQLTADYPVERSLIPELRSLANEKLAELAETISLFRSGKSDEAEAVVMSDAGLHIMNDIRTLMDKMSEQENSLQSSQWVTYQKSIRATTASIYLANVIAALGLILLAYVILHEMSLREKYAQQLLEREEWFRITLTSLGDAVIATDERGNVTFLNPLAEQLTGRSLLNCKGRAIHEVFPIFNESTHLPVENPVKRSWSLAS